MSPKIRFSNPNDQEIPTVPGRTYIPDDEWVFPPFIPEQPETIERYTVQR